VHTILYKNRAILIGGRFHKTEVFLDHKMSCIEMYNPAKDEAGLHAGENDEYVKCSVIKYKLLVGVPFQEIETFIYYVEEK